MLFKAENEHSWGTPRASAPLTRAKLISLSEPSSQTGEESGGGCSGCGFRGQRCSVSCYHSGQNRSLNWRASPAPRINWGVLMDSEWINWWLSYFAVLTRCALTAQHTHLHVHRCGAMQMFTPMSWFVSFLWEKGLVIDLVSANNIKLQTLDSYEQHKQFNLFVSWYSLMECNTRVSTQSQIHGLFIWAHFHSRLSQRCREIIRRRKVWFYHYQQQTNMYSFQEDSFKCVYPTTTALSPHAQYCSLTRLTARDHVSRFVHTFAAHLIVKQHCISFM